MPRQPKKRSEVWNGWLVNWLNLKELRASAEPQIVERKGKQEYHIPVATYPHPNPPERICCLAGVLKRHDKVKVRYRDRRIEPMPTVLIVERQRYKCHHCGAIVLEAMDADLDHKWYITHRFKRALQMASVKRNFQDAANLNGVDDSYIIRLFDEFATEKLEYYHTNLPEVLGVDENNLLGGMRFVAADLETGQILDLLPARTEAAVMAFFAELHWKFNVKVFVQDMWRGYRNVAEQMFPKALNIVDKFHVVRMANDGMADARKWYQTKLENEDRRSLKNKHRMFLARWDGMHSTSQDTLAEILEDHPFLNDAYVWKERFYMIYDSATRAEAEKEYDRLVATMPPHLKRFYRPLTTSMKNWRPQIFNHFEMPERWTNNMTENLNGRLNQINSMARGMTFDRFRKKAILRFGKIIPNNELAVYSGDPEDDPRQIGFGWDVSTLERALKKGRF